MAKTLTLKGLESERPGDKRREIPDAHTRGLYHIIQPGGARSWAFRFSLNGRTGKLTIGPYPAITIAEARAEAKAATAKVAKGIDPAAEKTEKREAIKAAKVKAEDASDTFDAYAERYLAHVAITCRTRTANERARIFKRELKGWQGRKLAKIERDDVKDIIDGIMARGKSITANRTFALISNFFSYALAQRNSPITASPCAGLKRPMKVEPTRARILKDQELKAIYLAAGTAGKPYGSIIKVLALTGARLTEVAAMTWRELDLEARSWTLPASRAKNKVEHTIPLSDAVMAIIEALPRDYLFVFANRLGRVFQQWVKSKRALDAASGVSGWVVHDLRRTFVSGLARLQVDVLVTERLVNHVGESFSGVKGVYNRERFEPEQRAAMALWAAHVEHLVSGVEDALNGADPKSVDGVPIEIGLRSHG
ncbi:tyrosine-type recombinase/integrase [Methylocella sp.]|jgi:integrase|uniref:tyrosine-type recombinase/integrase n=1 Tax=Methylocella sp. TaxID=1978226 RepID=UPI003C1B8368